MDFDLADDERLLRDTVREFARGEIAPAVEELDRTKSFPYEIVRRLGALDLMGIPFPQEYGGAGGTTQLRRRQHAHARGATERRVGGRRRQAVHHQRRDRHLGAGRDHGAHR